VHAGEQQVQAGMRLARLRGILGRGWRLPDQPSHHPLPNNVEDKIMSKGLDQKKSDKKKPAKTMKEKKADKKDKKANKAFSPN